MGDADIMRRQQIGDDLTIEQLPDGRWKMAGHIGGLRRLIIDDSVANLVRFALAQVNRG